MPTHLWRNRGIPTGAVGRGAAEAQAGRPRPPCYPVTARAGPGEELSMKDVMQALVKRDLTQAGVSLQEVPVPSPGPGQRA